MKRLVLALAASCALVPGCSCPSAELKKRAGPRDASPVVALPEGSRWKTAKVVVDVSSSTREYSGRNFGTQTTWHVSQTLVLACASGETQVRLLPDSGDSTDAGSALAAADAKWRLEVADGGRGIACAEEREAEWLWVALDGPAPYHCPRVRCGTTAGPPAPAPGARALLLALFLSPERKEPWKDAPSLSEWAHAAAVATAEPADPELRRALALAALRPKSGFQARLHAPATLDPLRELVKADEGLRSSCVEALGSASEDVVRCANAASLLEQCREDEVLAALAEALAAVIPKRGDGGEVSACRAEVAFGIARFREVRGGLPAVVSARLAPDLEAEPRPSDQAIFYVIYAARGVPELRPALESLAAKAPEGELPAWPATLDELRASVQKVNWVDQVKSTRFARAALMAK
jgi:hypothetical protein